MPHTLIPSALTSCQSRAFDLLQREGNVFLTGAAGTGKSFLLSQYLRDKPSEDFPVVASTGAAAVLVGGRTFHSFFGLGILEGGREAAIARAIKNRKVQRRLQRALCVVIDEISMLPGNILAAAELVARAARGRDEPWGGLRIVAVGDFAQLPPVSQGGFKDWAFRHAVWSESGFQPSLLSTVVRTEDRDFLDILNFVRTGTVHDSVRAFLDAHTGEEEEDARQTRLYPHRAQAEEHNLRRLERIPRSLAVFPTHFEGAEEARAQARRVVPIPDTLLLKEEALVMMRKNDLEEPQRFVNGSLGIVRSIEDDALHITLLSGETVEVEPQKFTVLNGDGAEIAAAWNFPVTLAWATTIHKAQGASLDRIAVDLAALWEPGQAYVALSRARSPGGVRIMRWTPSSIRADPLVTAFYDGLAEETQRYEPRPLFTAKRIGIPKPLPRRKKKSRLASSHQKSMVHSRSLR